MILVVGAGLRSLRADLSWLSGSGLDVILRSSEIADTLPADVGFEHTYDDLLSSDLDTNLPTIIAKDLLDRSRDHGIAYVVQGAGNMGDAIVEALVGLSEVEFRPAPLGLEYFGSQIQVIDALTLALAEQEFPFDAGRAAIDPTANALILNVTTGPIANLTWKRLERIYSTLDARDITQDETCFLPAQNPTENPSGSMSALQHIMSRLRREDGCPWDREQTYESLIPMFVEEVEELSEAVTNQDCGNQIEELGDLLMLAVMMSQIGREMGDFDLYDALESASAKMIRRHPHVFADLEIDSIDELKRTWDEIKLREKHEQ